MRNSPIERKSELKRTEFRRTGAGLMRHKRLRHRSDKVRDQMDRYIPEMLEFLLVHAWCEFPGCDQPSTVLHHRKGRNGRRLRDQRFWAASCDFCNEFAETHTGEALAIGWLLRINGKAS